MERRERVPPRGLNANEVAIKAGIGDAQANMWTALPATVDSFDAGKVTVVAQPTIQAQIWQPNGTWVDTTMPLCLDCPVLFPGGGGFVFTFPLVKGNEGLLIFSSRCIDAWWQNGGVQKQAELRMHDLSDGFFIPTGGMSQPNKPGNISADSAQMRTSDGTEFIELNPTTHTISLKAANIALLGNVQMGAAGDTITGQNGGAVDFGTTQVKQGGKDIGATHTHSDPQGGNTGPVN